MSPCRKSAGASQSLAENRIYLSGNGVEVGGHALDANGVVESEGGVDEIAGAIVINEDADIAGMFVGALHRNPGMDDSERANRRIAGGHFHPSIPQLQVSVVPEHIFAGMRVVGAERTVLDSVRRRLKKFAL